jgi:signal transduction histidine kinase
MGQRDAFAWPVGVFLTFGYASAFFFLKYLRDPNLSPDWLSVWAIAQFALLLGFFAIKLLLLNRLTYDKPHPWLHTLVIFMLGVWQAAVSNWIQVAWGLPLLKAFVFALLASGAFELVMFGLATSLYQSFKMNRATVASLLQTQNQLLGLRESAEVIVLEEELRLVHQTQVYLLPQLEVLDASLESTGYARAERDKLIQDIRSTIETKVRPLSDELKSSAQVRAVPLTSSSVQPSGLRVPRRLNLRDAFRPGEIFALTALAFVACPLLIIGPIWGLFGLIAALHYGLWLLVFRTLIPTRLRLKTPIGVLVLTLLALAPVLPVSATLLAFAPNPQDSRLITAAFIFMVVVVATGLVFLHGLYQALEEVQAQLTRRIDELRRETSRFDQQLWSARRNWGYVIHGTVQSSLTAALLHLQKADGTDEDLVKVVRQDIRRAVQALRERPVSQADLKSSMAELQETWAGVCNIDWHISDEARQALVADADLGFCTKEIVKEAISNAVRHGGATLMTVSLVLESGHTLVLEAVNNGRVLDESVEAGLGSQIIQDLSYFWSLSSDPASGLTTLVAKMALPRG